MAGTPEHAPHLPHMPVPDIKGAAKWAFAHWQPVGLSLAAAATGAYFALAPDKGPSAPPVNNAPVSDKAPDPAPNQPSLALNPPFTETNPGQPAATAEPPKPNTPEARETMECGVVDPNYRKYAEVIDWRNPSGKILKLVGFRFPKERDKEGNDKKISIKAPMNGQIAYTENRSVFNGTRAVLSDPNNQTGIRFEYDGNLITESGASRDVIQGGNIGHSGSGDLKAINGSDYDLIVYAIKGSSADEEALKAVCPEAFTKSPVPIALDLTKPPTTYTDIYIPKGQDLTSAVANSR